VLIVVLEFLLLLLDYFLLIFLDFFDSCFPLVVIVGPHLDILLLFLSIEIKLIL
jgi:hypothetical protein